MGHFTRNTARNEYHLDRRGWMPRYEYCFLFRPGTSNLSQQCIDHCNVDSSITEGENVISRLRLRIFTKSWTIRFNSRAGFG
uniref:Uncharacterized protein n=1 Tax=Physcomitrium patens TaxID=3218 RepID=A0A7I4EMD5_PHYPA